jgi:hypothetical protein
MEDQSIHFILIILTSVKSYRPSVVCDGPDLTFLAVDYFWRILNPVLISMSEAVMGSRDSLTSQMRKRVFPPTSTEISQGGKTKKSNVDSEIQRSEQRKA